MNRAKTSYRNWLLSISEIILPCFIFLLFFCSVAIAQGSTPNNPREDQWRSVGAINVLVGKHQFKHSDPASGIKKGSITVRGPGYIGYLSRQIHSTGSSVWLKKLNGVVQSVQWLGNRSLLRGPSGWVWDGQEDNSSDFIPNPNKGGWVPGPTEKNPTTTWEVWVGYEGDVVPPDRNDIAIEYEFWYLPIKGGRVIQSSSSSVEQPAGSSSGGPTKCGLGKSWDVTEPYGWTSVWSRRGNSNIFDALWTNGAKQEKAVLTISINGNTVSVKRKQSAGYSYPGQECTYKGTLAADNVTVTGTYGCAWAAGPFNWQATIRCDSNGDITKTTGTGSSGGTPGGGGGGGPTQGTARLLTVNSNQDMVGRNEKFRGNGRYDAIFQAQFSAPNRTVTAVEVSNTNGIRSVWDTRPNNRLWLGGVVIGGRAMNRPDGSVNFGPGSGQNTLHFFVEDNGSIRGGKTNYRMTIFFVSGDPLIMNITPTGTQHPPGNITKISNIGSTGFTLDFETGRTDGWTKTGTAFNHQPTYGDNPTARHRGQPSKHVGNYWIGTYEKYQGYGSQTPGSVQGDGPIGALTSNVFTIPTGSLSFLVGGGSSFQTRVELLVSGNRVLSVSGRGTETMHRVKWDLNPWSGQQGQIRLVDNASGGWGHINADDFRFSHSSSSGGTSGGIRIESATYGGNCGVAKGNVTAHIDRQCNGKSRCRYTVNYKIIGDLAPGCAKTYTVRYRCGNNPQVFEKSLTAEAGWGDKSVLLECAD